jgi:PEP-CTERM motif
MKRIMSVVIALSTGLLASPAFAGEISASATISSVPDGANFDYTINLTNTSTGASADPIATFWFSWVPGADFMNTAPISVTIPSGWTDLVTNAGPTDGFAIQFDSTSAANDLAPGASTSFSFVSATTPAQLAGISPSTGVGMFPELTSFVYSQGPLQGDGAGPFLVEQVAAVVSSVPEPSSLVLGLFGVVTSFGYMQFRNRKRITA